MSDLSAAKRAGKKLSAKSIRALIAGFTTGKVSEDVMADFTHAVLEQGMTRAEVDELTEAMMDSGHRLDFSSLNKPIIDKHSTGGVGDKITLILTPLMASYGILIPQLAGRGLGHTGGTIDKLESIPGWKASLSLEEMQTQLATVGAFISSAGELVAPADAKLYALRDVSGTVASIPLIASSIMSKKLAEGLHGLVLDVKCGSGAFMKDLGSARELAHTLVSIGRDAGVKTSAFITNMNLPLGREVGNANEVAEALDVLEGRGPQDVRELALALAKEMLYLAGIKDIDPVNNLDNGKALQKWRELISAQGGNPDAPLPQPAATETIVSSVSGEVLAIDAGTIGAATWQLGAGRRALGDVIDHTAGVTLHAKPGEYVDAGKPLFTVMAQSDRHFDTVTENILSSYRMGEVGEYRESSVVMERITMEDHA